MKNILTHNKMGGFTAVVNFLMLFIFLAVGISFLYYYNVQTIADYSDFIETTKADSLKFEENAYSLQGPILYSGEKYLVLRNDGEKSIILRDEGVNIFDIYKNGRILNESEFRFVLPMNTSAIYDFIEPNSYALLYFNEEIEKGDNISFISQRGIELEYEYLGDYWWDNSWFGRSDINVYNPSSENLFEYQVEVDLVKENFDFKFAKPENFRTMVPLEEYLILALPFENYLQQTNDSSGFNHKVVLGSDVSSNPSDPAFANSSGFRSNGLYFDGVNDYVTVEDDDVFDNLEKFSLSFWFKPDTLTGDPVGIVSKRNNFNDNAAFSVFIWSGNQINVDIDTSNDRFSSNYVVKEDEWQNVVLVFDGTLDPSQRVKLYVDGELDGVYSESSDMIPKYNSQFTIGTMDEGYPDYFNGHIDEVQMYDLALNEDEVEDIYNDELMIFRELDFYVDKYDYLEEEGKLFVKLPTLGSKRDLNFHLYADFMRDRLNSKSSIVDTFSYSDIFKVGYLVGDYYETEGIDIMSLFDDNEIIVGTDSYSMDFAEFSNLSGSSVDAEDEVYMKFPAQIEGMAEGGDVMVPISWASDEFFLGGLRAGTDRICLLSPWSDAVYRVWSNDVVIRDSSLNDGVVSCFNLSVSSTSAVRISSNVSVLGYYHGTSDSYPLYPASNGEFYGIASENAYLTTGPLSSRVKARNISGTTFFDSVIAQNDVEHFSEVGPGGSATAYRVDSENFIGMIQQDDGDGAESSLFTPRHEMGTIFGSIQPLQYLSIVSPYDDAICLVYNASGDIVVGYVDTTPEMNFFYPANNNASDSVLDKSGKGNDLVVGNGAPTWVSGASFDGSGAFEFDGNGEYYEVPDGENYINGLSEFTVSVWIKADQIGTDRPIFDSEMPDNGDDVFGLRYDVSGYEGGCVNCFKAAIATSDQGANVVQIESSSDLQKTTWQHVAFRWKSGQQLELFIDGLHDLGSYASGIGTGTLIGSDRLMIGNGAKGSLSGNSWDGMIDEFRFFPSYLSDDQVYNLYLNDFSQYVNFTQAKGSNGVYQYEFGTNDSNILVDNGWILKCDREVWPYFEDGNDDESNLFGYKQMRQYVYPRPYVVVNDVPIEINWTSLDIGSVNAWGKYYFDDGAYIVEASGQNTTSSSDEFHYLALSEESDFNVTVKVSDLDGNGPESKAGIMFREDLLADSKFAGIFLTSGNGLTFEWREFSSGNANFENLTGVSDPVWLRLVRENDNFSGFYSNDGVNWNFLEDATIAMDSQYNYGLAVTSNQDGNITRAVFENFDSN